MKVVWSLKKVREIIVYRILKKDKHLKVKKKIDAYSKLNTR